MAHEWNGHCGKDEDEQWARRHGLLFKIYDLATVNTQCLRNPQGADPKTTSSKVPLS